MKCPYRKTVVELNNGDLHGTDEWFADCYGEECPLYVPGQNYSGGISTSGYCRRAYNEHNK